MSERTKPLLYSFVRCPYAMRARIALVDSNISYILREVNLRDKPKQLLEISPKGTVPVMVLENGDLIEESMDIVYYAASQNPDLSLDQYDSGKVEEIKSLVHNNDNHFVKLVNIYKYPDRYPDKSPSESRRLIEDTYLGFYEEKLQEGDFLLGNKSVADIALLPFVRQFAKVDEEYFFNSKYKKIIKWMESFTESDDFKNIVMLKNPGWQEGDEEILVSKI